MVSPFVGVVYLSRTFSLSMTTFYFARLTPKSATSLCASLVTMKLRWVKKLTIISLRFSLAQTPPPPLRMRSSTSLVRCKTLGIRSTLVYPLWLGNKKHKSLLKKKKANKKLVGWKENLLSIGGKEVLIKIMAQAVPMYTMSCFLLPKTLCNDLERMMRNFLWGQRNQE